MNTELYDNLLFFVKLSTKNFDETHDYKHAISVTKNALKIANNTLSEQDEKILLISSMLHDVYDHKYQDISISKEHLHEFIKIIDEDNYEDIIEIIDNVSYSTEIKNPNKKINKQYLLDIVRDADRQEALGINGLYRCVQFNRHKLGCNDDEELKNNLIKHYHEKLITLYDNFIVTEKGKELAKPFNEEMIEFMNDPDNNIRIKLLKKK
jgi:hypothetical protein